MTGNNKHELVKHGLIVSMINSNLCIIHIVEIIILLYSHVSVTMAMLLISTIKHMCRTDNNKVPGASHFFSSRLCNTIVKIY